MPTNTPTNFRFSHTTLVKLAREIAIDHYTADEILSRNGLSATDWSQIQVHPRFRELLETELVAWHSATNTHERVKLKAAALIEEWLTEANTRIHDPKESLSAKTELGKLLTRIAGMGLNDTNINSQGEKMSITINLGEDSKLKFEKDITPRVIEGSATEG